ncbi:MAG: divergent PAP2 family protein [Kiritimatiellae bacterium]|nr:divergent PAP2 family protein [Kiritimatiellia bacterium]
MDFAGIVADWNAGHFFTHPWFWASFCAWMAAQTIKLLRSLRTTHTVDFEYLVSTGGMPSAHSAMVAGLATSIGLTEGFGTPIAMLALGFAVVTMFDAATVRRAAGEQAKVLNSMLREIRELKFKPKHLKELLGHTRKEVFWGMVLGACVAVLVCSLWPASFHCAG